NLFVDNGEMHVDRRAVGRVTANFPHGKLDRMTVTPLGFGLIGFGAWGRFHADAIAKTSGAKLKAIAARSDASRRAAQEAFPHAKIYADFLELLASPDIEVVDVVVPSNLHHEIASDTLAAGKHLLLEKPMALSLRECDDLIALARKHNRVFAVGHELRLSSLW